MVSDNWISNSNVIKKPQLYLTAANDILKGRLVVFKRNVDTYDVVRCWNKDPSTGIHAPMGFGKRLDYRNQSLVGDIKYLWEPNRHLHLVTLAQAYLVSKNRVYLKALKLHIGSWIEQCPYLMGPNWSSSLEVSIRLINWSIVWQMIDGPHSELFADETNAKFKGDWLGSIFQHLSFISENLSKGTLQPITILLVRLLDFSSVQTHGLIGRKRQTDGDLSVKKYWSKRHKSRVFSTGELASKLSLINNSC